MQSVLTLDWPDLDFLFIQRKRYADRAEKMRSIVRNRNHVRKVFCEGKWEYLLFVDDDQILPRETIQKLMALTPTYDIIAGVTSPRENLGAPSTAYQFLREQKGGGEDIPIPVDKRKDDEGNDVFTRVALYNPELPYVDVVGMFCTLIKRKVLKDVKFSAPINHVNLGFDDQGKGRFSSLAEDGWFCVEAKKRGYRVAEVRDLRIVHNPAFAEGEHDRRASKGTTAASG